MFSSCSSLVLESDGPALHGPPEFRFKKKGERKKSNLLCSDYFCVSVTQCSPRNTVPVGGSLDSHPACGGEQQPGEHMQTREGGNFLGGLGKCSFIP